MPGAASGDHWRDAALTDQAPVSVVVVAAVGLHLPGAAQRSPTAAAPGRHLVDQRDELGDVVAVAAGQRHHQRHTARVGDQMMLGTGTATVDRAWPDLVPSFTARR